MCLNLNMSFPLLGIAVASGIATARNIASSLLVAAGIFHDEIKNIGLTILGVLFTACGLAGFSYIGHSSGTVRTSGEGGAASDVSGVEVSVEASGLLGGDGKPKARAEFVGGSDGKPRYVAGILAAMFIGFMGGFTLVPNMACCANAGLMFFPSMGIGVLLSAPLYSLATLPLIPPTEAMPLVPSAEVLTRAVPMTILGGAFQAAGVLLTIIAIDLVDYVVAMTLGQMSILVTASWGILYFKEVTGAVAIAGFLGSALVLIGGASLVAVYGVV
jgi:hypothetical protein